jgi:hypothetical protein
MDKKPLIGVSICAVVLLVLGSLSNVVGYSSVKSTVNDSPLFATRTQRATNQQQNLLTSQYLGMGKETLLQFSIRDNRTEQLKKAIDIISKMDDKVFAWFTELCLRRIRQDKSLEDMNPNKIITSLYLLKTNSLAIINSFTDKNDEEVTSDGLITICFWFPGCIPMIIILLPITIIVELIWSYWEKHPTSGPTCFSVEAGHP